MTLDLRELVVLSVGYWDGLANQIYAHKAAGVVSQGLVDLDRAIRTINANSKLLDDDKVYFTCFSEVPRYKFNEYSKTKPELSRVILPTKATVYVADTTKISSCFEGMLNIGATTYLSFPKTIMGYHKSSIVGNITYDALPDDIWVDQRYLGTLAALVPMNMAGSNATIALRTPYYRANFEQLKDLISDASLIVEARIQGKRVMSDLALLEEINQGVEITAEIHDQLCKMLKSSDPENVALGMDLLANSNYKKSEFRIVMLLNKYRDTIRSHNNFGRVNFKSLIAFFSKWAWMSGDIPFAQSVLAQSSKDAPDYNERIEVVQKSVLDYLNSMLHDTRFSVPQVDVRT